jgi:type IV pilus assembly protein PilB
LLRKVQKSFSLQDLGFSNGHQEQISQALKARHGLILVTGPTGSGKTTTLYTLLNMLKENSVSIVTIEDPIEYAIKGVRQIQARERRGLNFSNGLRSILRQDPDIIMIGEIRDQETAAIAVNAALTGHLVLSTLHTNNALASIIRLIEMKIEPYLLAATLQLVISQRLVRSLCVECKVNRPVTEIEEVLFKQLSAQENLNSCWAGTGCSHCSGTGFKGRTIIAEVFKSNQHFRHSISTDHSISNLQKNALESGFIPIVQHGLEKYLLGQTVIEEIVHSTYE